MDGASKRTAREPERPQQTRRAGLLSETWTVELSNSTSVARRYGFCSIVSCSAMPVGVAVNVISTARNACS